MQKCMASAATTCDLHNGHPPWRLLMSALGQKQTSRHVRDMSVSPLKADIHQGSLHVRLVPTADSKPERPRTVRNGTKPSALSWPSGVGLLRETLLWLKSLAVFR